MKQHLKKLGTAALISSSVFALNYFWYESSGTKYSSNSNEKPLAYVGEVVEDIQRRPAARLLWQSVNQGEALFNGEAIRTSEKGEVRIQFAGSDRYLDLEPESLIVIKQSAGEIALDLMEGSLFVNASAGAGDAGGPGLVLNSENGKVDLSKATASLSKTKGQEINLQVIEGKASIQGKDGQTKEIATGTSGSLTSTGEVFDNSKIQILSPAPGKPLYRNPETLEPVVFQWTGFPEGTEVSLWSGSSRKNLVKVSATTKSELEAPLNLGKNFWKLVATKDNKVVGESPLYRNEILPRAMPTVIFPTADLDIEFKGESYTMQFKWQKGDSASGVAIEIWSDEKLKNSVASKRFTNEDTFEVPNLSPGTYYWRMATYFLESEKPAVNKVQKFTVRKYIEKKVDLAWNVPELEEKQNFVNEPEVQVTWKPAESEDVKSYKVVVKPATPDESIAPVEKVVSEASFKTPVAKPGRYIASIEALNDKGQVIGKAPEKILDISELPKIAAPKFLGNGPKLEASQDGKLEVNWTALPEAKEYELIIYKDGKELKRTRYSKNTTTIKNLMPGEYQAELFAIDKHGRQSEGLDTKAIVVPENSGLKAPSLKKIKVN